jgi:hypothetical protein
MLCTQCSHWTAETFTYYTLEATWNRLHGVPIPPGLKTKFRTHAERFGCDFSETELPFVYCRKGCISRFYVIRKAHDHRPRRVIVSCPSYSIAAQDNEELPSLSHLWQLCATESHGPTVVHGHQFYPGLCENFAYFRLPAHRSIRPEIGVTGQCFICGQSFDKGIAVQETTWLCSNRHYLQWWRMRNPAVFERLNRRR